MENIYRKYEAKKIKKSQILSKGILEEFPRDEEWKDDAFDYFVMKGSKGD